MEKETIVGGGWISRSKKPVATGTEVPVVNMALHLYPTLPNNKKSPWEYYSD